MDTELKHYFILKKTAGVANNNKNKTGVHINSSQESILVVNAMF